MVSLRTLSTGGTTIDPKITPMINATATSSASRAFHHTAPCSQAAAPVPATTGATALGRVRGRAPSIHCATVAMAEIVAPDQALWCTSPATRLIAIARMTAPSRNDTRAWKSTVLRIC